MDIANLIAYALIVLGFVFIPGPATLLTVARASTSGVRAGLATGAGIAVGDLIHTAMAIVGLSALIAASASLFTLIKYAGAGYLVFLGVKAILDRTPPALLGAASTIGAATAFRQAVITEVLNPKTALFFLAFLPQFVDQTAGAITMQLAIYGLVFVLLGFVSTAIFAIGAGRLGGLLRRNPAITRLQGKVVGSIYCALGVRLALQER